MPEKCTWNVSSMEAFLLAAWTLALAWSLAATPDARPKAGFVLPQNKQNNGFQFFFFGFSVQVNQWCLEQMETAQSNKKDDFLFRGDLFTSTLERWMPQKQFVFKWWFYYTIFDNDLGIRDMLLSDPVTYLYIYIYLYLYFGDLHISYGFVSFRSILFGSISGLASVALKFLKSSEAPERCSIVHECVATLRHLDRSAPHLKPITVEVTPDLPYQMTRLPSPETEAMLWLLNHRMSSSLSWTNCLTMPY